MSHLFGLVIAVVLLRSTMWVLKMDVAYYFDEVAALIVFGGTACAAIITYPVSDLLKMAQALFRIAKKVPEQREMTVAQIVRLAQLAQKSQAALDDASKDKGLNPYLRDGLELILSGFSRQDLEEIMAERLHRDREREESYGGLLRTISKYPPAFGLIGTVLGLVTVMRSVAAGGDAAEIGTQMALALVATFYGLILTNFLLVPMSENLFNKSAANMVHRELMLEGLLMIYDRSSPVVVQEKLNSFLPPMKRKDLIGLGGPSRAA
ncbi:MAG: motility protein A [Bdellovibrionales bacterium]